MAKTDSRFREDSLGALCQLVHIEPDALRPLLDWINAPPNLQQFRAVIGNLLQLFEFAQSSPLLPELNLEEVRVTEWKTTLQTLHDTLPADFPRELRHLNAREDVRPNGLIGSYSEYASLVASNPRYPAEQEVAIRCLHFIALGCAAGYRQQIASGEVKQSTDCIYSGMLKIRALEKPNKRPAFPIPDLTAATSLDECQAQIEALANAASDDDSHTWCQMIRGLIRAYREGREGNRGGYRLKVDRVVEPETLSEQDDPDWITETGYSRPPPLITVTTFVSRPDKASSRELTNLGLSPEEWATQTAIAFDEPGTPIHATQNAQLSRLRNRGRLNAIIQSAQTLPDSWGTPTAYEIEQLVRQLSRDLQPALKIIPPADIPALQALLLLRLWTGRPLDDLLALRLVPDLERYTVHNQQQLTFIEDAAVLALPISSPTRQRGINPIDQALLQSPELGGRPASSESSIFVRLPKTATAILKKFFDGWHQTKRRKASSQPFQHRNTNFAEGIKSYLANINDQSATRWTEARQSQIMRQAILQSSGD
ncbi:hypothetical protein [Vogesella sp. AC12]|uniref:hypothetical protein n=1 Tax=Vogesella sp. AC12 TaxID=2950550 RepID=UPI00210EBCE4|nr:hypothetical protein [Vogesella sp. AC12]MCQ4143431.1 hypothetical protein [Vogesella sp. AC12]